MEPTPSLTEIYNWLITEDQEKLTELWKLADNTRQKYVGDAVHLRGLVEISNYCVQKCHYCGINSLCNNIERYRMSSSEILAAASQIAKFKYGTIVLQAGEDYGLETNWLAEIIKQIKATTDLAVTLSLGERPLEDLAIWRQAGADRYLIRFETGDKELYQAIHPTIHNNNRDRFAIISELQQLGYEVGSGVMIGIPGQTYTSLAKDILKFAELDLDMIGVGPYIPDPNTILGNQMLHSRESGTNLQEQIERTSYEVRRSPKGEYQDDTSNLDPHFLEDDTLSQVPNTELMTYKVIALTRLVCPTANIPSTTALASLNKMNGRELGLIRGANIVMPNCTPVKYRQKYTIYPNKACLNETAEQCQHCLAERIRTIGRTIGRGQGKRNKL
jgi:biotin synthase